MEICIILNVILSVLVVICGGNNATSNATTSTSSYATTSTSSSASTQTLNSRTVTSIQTTTILDTTIADLVQTTQGTDLVQTTQDEFYVNPAEDKVPIGENVVFECNAKVAAGAAPTLLWTFKGQEIAENVEGEYQLIHTSNEEERSTMSILTILNVQPSDAGDYVCSHDDGSLGTFSGKLEVYQHYDVKIKGDPILTVGEDLKFMCAVDEEYLLPIVWTKNNEALPIDTDDRYETAANNSLIILKVVETDAGVYTCTYSSGGMEFKDNITVGDALEVKGPKSIKYTEGERARFECTSVSQPPPTITWASENGTLDDRFEAPKVTKKGKELISTLILVGVKMEDRGNYICTADNGVDVKTHTIMLRVRDRLAALWPFIGIMCEVIILIAIIFIHEKCTQGNDDGEEDEDDEAMEPIKGGDTEKANSDGESDMRLRASKE